MRTAAIVAHAADDLRLDEIELSEPAPDEAVVAVRFGGICGSDVHYWKDGRAGESILSEPLVLGHEIVGVVQRAAADGSGPGAGTPVFVHPASVCGQCGYCRSGRSQLCVDLRYFGSAARFPHTPGGFTRQLVVASNRLLSVAGIRLQDAALVEPAAVSWHAVGRGTAASGDQAHDIAVVGAGPIGLLCIAALGVQAPQAVITAIDVLDRPLQIARTLGAQRTMLAAELQESSASGADLIFESSGTNAGLTTAIGLAKPGATIVGVGLLPPTSRDLPIPLIISRELSFLGSSRFYAEAGPVIDALRDGALRVQDVVTHVCQMEDYQDAFALAADGSVSSKVLIDFGQSAA